MSEQSSLASRAESLDAAVGAVRAASSACAAMQGRLAAGDTLTKSDASPVTVADFAAQAIVAALLIDRLGPIVLVGEEDAADLTGPEGAPMLDGITAIVSEALPTMAVTPDKVIEWIAAGGADPSAHSAFWTLDPIDGTKGFLRGDQFAIALARIDRGEVVAGALGCPNLPNADGTRGAVFAAGHGVCQAWLGGAGTPTSVRSSAVTDVSTARFCESVESGHSDHGQSAEIATRLGITRPPHRIDSQCKYAAIARGDAEIYLRLPTRADYREKIWDHAAGKFVVEQAGGTVTDVRGAPLNFSHGRRLETNSGVIATCGPIHADVVAAVQAVLG